jgi:hypothetical protein
MPGDSALRQVRRDLDMIDWLTAMGERRFSSLVRLATVRCARLWSAARQTARKDRIVDPPSDRFVAVLRERECVAGPPLHA